MIDSPICTPVKYAYRGCLWVVEKIKQIFSACVAMFVSMYQTIKNWIFPNRVTSTACPTGGASPSQTVSAPVIPVSSLAPETYEGLRVNPLRIRDIPTPFDPSIIELISQNANPPVREDQILEHFDELFRDVRDYDVLYNDEGSDIWKNEARQAIETSYLGYIRQNLNDVAYQFDQTQSRINPHHRTTEAWNSQVARNFRTLLRGLIVELRKDEIPVEKKRVALESLASAAEHCPPRRHEEILRIYKELTNQVETMDEILLSYVQQAKEAMFASFYSHSREPVMTLNYIRREVGLELGLDRNPVNLGDIYINMRDASFPVAAGTPGAALRITPRGQRYYSMEHTQPDQFLQVFNQLYTPENLMYQVKTKVSERLQRDADFRASLMLFIRHALVTHQQAGAVTQDQIDALPQPYIGTYREDGTPYDPIMDFDYEGPVAWGLTDAGIRFLLVELNFLQGDANCHIAAVPEEDASEG